MVIVTNYDIGSNVFAVINGEILKKKVHGLRLCVEPVDVQTLEGMSTEVGVFTEILIELSEKNHFAYLRSDYCFETLEEAELHLNPEPELTHIIEDED